VKNIICLCVFVSLVFNATVYADSEVVENKVNVDIFLENYLLSWATKDEKKRLMLLNSIWVENGEHQSPFGHSEGVDSISQEIAGFLQSNPDVTVEFKNVKKTGNNVVCDFVVKKPDGTVWIRGVDYFELNDAGKLLKVVGFI